jgi:hypothetical protein
LTNTQRLNLVALNIGFATFANTQFMMKGAILMINLIVGFFVGGFFGVIFMALFAANHYDDYFIGGKK